MGGGRIAIPAKPRHGATAPRNRHTGQNDIRLDLAQGIIAKPDAFHIAGAEVFHHDIGPQDKLTRQFHPARVRQVQRHTFLRCVGLREKGRAVMISRLACKRWRTPPQIKPARRLDLDDHGPVIGQILCRPWSGTDPTEVSYLYTF